jgi:hypothetical protein
LYVYQRVKPKQNDQNNDMMGNFMG